MPSVECRGCPCRVGLAPGAKLHQIFTGPTQGGFDAADLRALPYSTVGQGRARASMVVPTYLGTMALGGHSLQGVSLGQYNSLLMSNMGAMGLQMTGLQDHTHRYSF